MKRFARLLLVTFGFGVLGLAVSFVPQKTASGNTSTNVNVTNPAFAVTQSTVPWVVSGTVGLVSDTTVGLAAGTSVGINNLASNPVPVGMPSHLGMKPSQFVNLWQESPMPNATDWHRRMPDGTDISPFSIGAGNVLVVTDIEFQVSGTPGAFAHIALTQPFPPIALPGWLSPEAAFDSAGVAQATDHLSAGLVMTALPYVNGVEPNQFLNFVSMQGYVTTQQ